MFSFSTKIFVTPICPEAKLLTFTKVPGRVAENDERVEVTAAPQRMRMASVCSNLIIFDHCSFRVYYRRSIDANPADYEDGEQHSKDGPMAVCLQTNPTRLLSFDLLILKRESIFEGLTVNDVLKQITDLICVKAYIGVKDYNEYMDAVRCFACLYDIVTDRMRLAFDFDGEKIEASDEEIEIKRKEFQTQAVDCVEKIWKQCGFDIDSPTPKLVWSYSTGRKLSFHCVVHGYYYTEDQVSALKKQIKTSLVELSLITPFIKLRDDKKEFACPDTGIYSSHHALRCITCVKIGDPERQKKPFHSAQPSEDLMDLVREHSTFASDQDSIPLAIDMDPKTERKRAHHCISTGSRTNIEMIEIQKCPTSKFLSKYISECVHHSYDCDVWTMENMGAWSYRCIPKLPVDECLVDPTKKHSSPRHSVLIARVLNDRNVQFSIFCFADGSNILPIPDQELKKASVNFMRDLGIRNLFDEKLSFDEWSATIEREGKEIPESEREGPNHQFLTVNCLRTASWCSIIRSSMDTGKSTVMFDYAAEEALKGKRILMIVHRQALSAAHFEKFQNTVEKMKMKGIIVPDARWYKQKDQDHGFYGLSCENVLIICVDSLLRMAQKQTKTEKKWMMQTYDCVILDECESLFLHLENEKTYLAKKRNVILNLLLTLINYAEKVLCLDGDAADRTYYIMKELAGMREVEVLINPVHTLYRCFMLTAELSDWKQQISDAVKEKKKVAVACTNKRVAMKTYKEFLDTGVITEDNSVFVSADHIPDDVCKFCRGSEWTENDSKMDLIMHFNEYLEKKQVQLLIYTPVIGVGIDIQYEFDKQFLMITGGSGTPRDAGQLFGRVRKVKDPNVPTWAMSVSHGCPYQLNGIQEYRDSIIGVVKRELQEENILDGQPHRSVRLETSPAINVCAAYNQYETRRSVKAFWEFFCYLQEKAGRTIEGDLELMAAERRKKKERKKRVLKHPQPCPEQEEIIEKYGDISKDDWMNEIPWDSFEQFERFREMKFSQNHRLIRIRNKKSEMLIRSQLPLEHFGLYAGDSRFQRVYDVLKAVEQGYDRKCPIALQHYQQYIQEAEKLVCALGFEGLNDTDEYPKDQLDDCFARSNGTVGSAWHSKGFEERLQGLYEGWKGEIMTLRKALLFMNQYVLYPLKLKIESRRTDIEPRTMMYRLAITDVDDVIASQYVDCAQRLGFHSTDPWGVVCELLQVSRDIMKNPERPWWCYSLNETV